MSGGDAAGISSPLRSAPATSTETQPAGLLGVLNDPQTPAPAAVEEAITDTQSVARHGLPASVIHELRTPLTSIHGYAQVLQRSLRDNARATNALGVVVRESTRL